VAANVKKIAKPLKRTANPKKINAKRTAKSFARAYGSETRVLWIKSLPCLACVALTVPQRFPTENVHTRTGGMGRKADADTIIPLCTYHHDELHRHGPVAFEARYGWSLVDAAAHIATQWEDGI